jgi:hypothetical protein
VKANKVVFNITMEALSIDVLRGMLLDVLAHVEREVESGKLEMADGDCIEWTTTRTPVNI